MDYQNKTKEELIQELKTLKRENISLKSSFEKDIAGYKQVQKDLTQIRDLLNNLACLVPGVICQYRLYPDGHSSFPYSSPGINDIYEVTPEEVLDDISPIYGRLHPDDYDLVKEAIYESAHTLQIFYCEFRVILPIQGLRWRWAQAYPERLPDGGTLWHGIILDITERKQSEEKLQQIIDELKRSQQIAHVGNWKLDLKTGAYTSSEEGLRIFGFPLGSYLKIQNISDCIHPDDLDRVTRRRGELPQSKECYTIEFRIINQETGQVKNIKSIGEIQCDEDNNPIAIVGTIQDITDNKRVKTENRLKLLSKAIAQSPVSVVITDKEGNIEYVNPKFATLTGYTLDEVKGKNPRILQSGEHPKKYYAALWDTILSGKEWNGEFHNKKKNGESYWESAIISPILNSHDEISYFVAVKEDITEKKKMLEDLIKAKEKAKESENLKTAFLNNISHEIRNPFNAILGLLSILQNEDVSTSERLEYISNINDSAHTFLNNLNNIVEISQIQSGQIKFSACNINIHEESLALFNHFKPDAEKKGLTFTFKCDLPNESKSINTDRLKLKAIVFNLLDNAIKYTEAGSIEFNVSRCDDHLNFSISDTGIGITEDKKQTIFDRFIQGDVSITRQFEGLGLGLSISKAYVGMLGGKIGVESEDKKGSTFCFTIPYNFVSSTL